MTFQPSWVILHRDDLDAQSPHIFHYVRASVVQVPCWSSVQDYVLSTDEPVWELSIIDTITCLKKNSDKIFQRGVKSSKIKNHTQKLKGQTEKEIQASRHIYIDFRDRIINRKVNREVFRKIV